MKYLYVYDNGIERKHTTVDLKKESILKESGNAERVAIYKITNEELEKTEYITTLILK